VGGGAPPGYALAQDLKKRFLTQKSGQLCWLCPVMQVTEKIKTDYYLLSSQVLLHPKFGS